MNGFCLTSERLLLRPRTMEEMTALQQQETDPEMRKAYGEMLEVMRRHPDQAVWATDWAIQLPSGITIGGIGFKGAPDPSGMVDLGYGIDASYRRQGFASEATATMTAWALSQPGVRIVTAQTEPDNFISQRVLLANGFVRDGNGDEGPRFVRKSGKALPKE